MRNRSPKALARRGKPVLFVLVAFAACTPKANVTDAPTILPVGSSSSARPHEGPADGDSSCFVNDVRVGLDVEVEPQGETPFSLRIRKLPMRVRVERPQAKRPGNPATVFVSGAVELQAKTTITAEAHFDSVTLLVARETDFANGLVRISPGHHLKDVKPHGAMVTSTVVLGHLTVDGVDSKCEDLAVGSSPIEGIELDVEAGASLLQPKGPTAQVCSDVGHSTCVTVNEEFTLVPVQTKGAWVEVRTKFKDGSAVHGWVKGVDLKATDAPTQMGYGATGGCGCRGTMGYKHKYPPDPREHYGEARIKAGTKITKTADGKGPWATVRGPLVAQIAMGAEDAFARITELPGISDQTGCDCDGLEDHAYVPRDAVTPIR